MNKSSKQITVIVVKPGGDEYEVEVNPDLNDRDLLALLRQHPELQPFHDDIDYGLRKVHRLGGKIAEGSVVVIDPIQQSGVGRATKRNY